MKGDFTRSTFRSEHHYSSVLMQQGRVQLDADWNEQMAIQAHLDATTRSDVIGLSGASGAQAGFAVRVEGNTLRIGAGRYYVDGLLGENAQDVEITAQPNLPDFRLPTEPGIYLAYLDIWRRHITAVEDPGIREVALGGPDTSTRTKTICQVKILRVGDVGMQASRFSAFDAWNALVAGRLQRIVGNSSRR